MVATGVLDVGRTNALIFFVDFGAKPKLRSCSLTEHKGTVAFPIRHRKTCYNFIQFRNLTYVTADKMTIDKHVVC